MGETPKVEGHPGRIAQLDKVKFFIKGDEPRFAGEPEGWGVRSEQAIDDGGSDALAAPRGNDGNGGQFAGAVAVWFYLTAADDLVIGRFSQDKL